MNQNTKLREFEYCVSLTEDPSRLIPYDQLQSTNGEIIAKGARALIGGHE